MASLATNIVCGIFKFRITKYIFGFYHIWHIVRGEIGNNNKNNLVSFIVDVS